MLIAFNLEELDFMFKRLTILFLCSLIFSPMFSFNKKGYIFQMIEYDTKLFIDEMGPDGAEDVIRKASNGINLPELDFWFRRIPESSLSEPQIDFLVDKTYKKFSIHSMKLYWDENVYVLYKNKVFNMPEKLSYIDNEENCKGLYYLTDGKFYWTRFEMLTPVNKREKYPKWDLMKIFKGKVPGDKFKAQVVIEYQFDDLPVKERVFKYDVITHEYF